MKEKDFYITDLHQNSDKTFILGYTDEEGIERLYQVTVNINSQNELTVLKSVKKS